MSNVAHKMIGQMFSVQQHCANVFRFAITYCNRVIAVSIHSYFYKPELVVVNVIVYDSFFYRKSRQLRFQKCASFLLFLLQSAAFC